MPVRTLVLNSIAGNKLSHPISLKQLKSMKHVAVANKNSINLTPFICFAIAQAVGADVYEDFFLDEKKKDHGLHYRKSIFGWVVTGVLSHVRGYQQSSSCSRTRPCSLLGGREESSSDADVQWKSSLCGTLQHIDLFCIWRLHHCLLPFKVWSTFFEQFSNSQAEIVRSGAETQWSRWSAAAVSWIQSRNVYFWEVEKIPRVTPMFNENRHCVEHYNTSTYFAYDGCITVCCPLKSEARSSNNFLTAKQRLFALERKLNDHDEVLQQYPEFNQGMCTWTCTFAHESLGRSSWDLRNVLLRTPTLCVQGYYDDSASCHVWYQQQVSKWLFFQRLAAALTPLTRQRIRHPHSLPPTPTCFVGRCGKDLQVGGFIRVRSWLPSNSVASLRDGRDTRNAYDPWDVRCCQLLLPFNPITSRDW